MTTQGNTIEGLDVGKLIRRVMFDQGMNKARLSRRVKRDASGLKRIIYNSSVQTYLVWEIGMALKHNFFADLAAQFRTACPEALHYLLTITTPELRNRHYGQGKWARAGEFMSDLNNN